MKIAMIGSRGIPACYGGLEKHVHEISRRLSKMGLDVLVYCRSPFTDDRSCFYKGIERIILPTVKYKNLDTIIYAFLATIDVIFRRVDVVHYHGIGPAIFIGLPRLFGKKTVVTIHSLNWQHSKWGKGAQLFLKLSEKIAILFAHEVIVVSKDLKAYINEYYQREALYIPNGIETPVFRTSDHIKQWKLMPQQYILTVSRLVPEKGLHHLIQAYTQLKTNFPLVVAGRVDKSDSYAQRLLDASNSHVIYVGFQQKETLQELYSNARLFVLPSQREGLPIALIEALSYALPCLASDIPANVEGLHNFGMTFKSGDAADLGMRLQEILDKPTSNHLAMQQASVFMQQHYNWMTSVAKLVKTYKHILRHETTNDFWWDGVKPRGYQFKLKCVDLLGRVCLHSGLINFLIKRRKKRQQHGQLFIIFYHQVAPTGKNAFLKVSPENFYAHVKYLSQHYDIISLDQLTTYLDAGKYPSKDSVVITFDDGTDDNYHYAFPILKKFNMPATIFMTGHYIGTRGMLTGAQIKEMAGHQITIGAHSMSHCRLSRLSKDEAREEIVQSKDILEELLKRPANYLAYPYGTENDFNSTTMEVAKEAGLRCAFSTIKHKDIFRSSRFALPRLGMANYTLPAFIAKLEGVFDFPSKLKLKILKQR